ncbi:unnamed protein product, partial [Strongylus vulgaris]
MERDLDRTQLSTASKRNREKSKEEVSEDEDLNKGADKTSAQGKAEVNEYNPSGEELQSYERIHIKKVKKKKKERDNESKRNGREKSRRTPTAKGLSSERDSSREEFVQKKLKSRVVTSKGRRSKEKTLKSTSSRNEEEFERRKRSSEEEKEWQRRLSWQASKSDYSGEKTENLNSKESCGGKKSSVETDGSLEKIEERIRMVEHSKRSREVDKEEDPLKVGKYSGEDVHPKENIDIGEERHSQEVAEPLQEEIVWEKEEVAQAHSMSPSRGSAEKQRADHLVFEHVGKWKSLESEGNIRENLEKEKKQGSQTEEFNPYFAKAPIEEECQKQDKFRDKNETLLSKEKSTSKSKEGTLES